MFWFVCLFSGFFVIVIITTAVSLNQNLQQWKKISTYTTVVLNTGRLAVHDTSFLWC